VNPRPICACGNPLCAGVLGAILDAHNHMVRPLRRKLDTRTRANIRAALDALVIAAEHLRGVTSPPQDHP